ncbi:hypothetical protein FACS189490_11960 [Clostridia bacterium]|nr:hypothetical protein FACS189490_11960 [Clostridia bacterium]
MDEGEYAVSLFARNFIRVRGMKIALYGTSTNTQAILDAFPWLSDSLLVDDAKAGHTIYTKRVFTINEACERGIRLLILIAREGNIPIIYKMTIQTAHGVL